MSDIAIKVENLSKRFQIGARTEKYKTFRDSFAGLFCPNGKAKGKPEPFWALKDISCEIKRGEVVGVIGRNGAGKSTFLKVLSRITEPTEGFAEIYGHVGSLLEVGTGFHPELSGRENVWLNGAILGMSRSDIANKFDDIVQFAEVQKFIDTPVKHYSSGMYLRLAFSVAAHLETEVLLVDEVLAVGDAQFQRKCLGKMGEVAQKGRTVLFVSHNLAAVVELCHRGIVLEKGRIKHDGPVGESVNAYAKAIVADAESDPALKGQYGFEGLKVSGSTSPTIGISDPITAAVNFKGVGEDNPLIYLIVEDPAGTIILHERISLNDISESKSRSDCPLQAEIPPLFLSPGLYSVYFKALSTSVGKPSRTLSERLPLVVRGETDALGRAMLCPKVQWSVAE